MASLHGEGTAITAVLTVQPAGLPHSSPPQSRRRLPLLAGYLRLARPPDTLFACIGTVIGAGLAGILQSSAANILIVAALTTLLSAASMMVNDWHDVLEDAVNRPDRPVPSGAVPRQHALGLGILLFAMGIVIAAFAGARFGITAVGLATLSVLYTWKLKALPIAGNATAGLLSSYPLWCWMLSNGFQSVAHVGAVGGFFAGAVGREIVRTAADVPGDCIRGIPTVACVWGARRANHAGLGLMMLGLAVAAASAIGSGFVGYQTALAIGGAAILIVGVRWVRASDASVASRRLTQLARVVTALLAAGVAWDLTARWLAR